MTIQHPTLLLVPVITAPYTAAGPSDVPFQIEALNSSCLLDWIWQMGHCKHLYFNVVDLHFSRLWICISYISV